MGGDQPAPTRTALHPPRNAALVGGGPVVPSHWVGHIGHLQAVGLWPTMLHHAVVLCPEPPMSQPLVRKQRLAASTVLLPPLLELGHELRVHGFRVAQKIALSQRPLVMVDSGVLIFPIAMALGSFSRCTTEWSKFGNVIR